MFAAPLTQTLEWNDTGVEGGSKPRRLWKTAHTHLLACENQEINAFHANDSITLSTALADLRRKTHETINKVNDDYGVRQQFNTAIAAIMELLNEINKVMTQVLSVYA